MRETFDPTGVAEWQSFYRLGRCNSGSVTARFYRWHVLGHAQRFQGRGTLTSASNQNGRTVNIPTSAVKVQNWCLFLAYIALCSRPGSVQPGPLPSKPNDQNREYHLNHTKENVVRPFSRHRDQHDRRVYRSKNDIQPPIQAWP